MKLCVIISYNRKVLDVVFEMRLQCNEYPFLYPFIHVIFYRQKLYKKNLSLRNIWWRDKKILKFERNYKLYLILIINKNIEINQI